ncbi:ATP-binding protein [Spongiactinospora rosea]|uniref:ATP-binding protein n=1 Tax=Spongiactinospora rosea TaxID=2248750 RepID=A0A366LJE8_9ACTN|nr:ATP-binding protein [Spongiactinospora rosea]RBQ14017.1 ATP-binding protein [Spongiactinospora rosea]
MSRFLGKVLLPGAESSVPVARAFARSLLEVHGYAGDVLAVLLVVSELVGNSVQHSDSGRVPDGRLWVTFERAGSVLHVTVADCGAETSVPEVRRHVADESQHGRGLALVDEFSDKWGVEKIVAGRAVWADLELKWSA